MKNGLLPFFLVAIFAFVANSQTVLKYVPSTADVVVTLNLQNLDKKVNLAQLQQYDFYQAMVKEMGKTSQFEDNLGIQTFFEKMLTAPASVGFAADEPIVVFVEKIGYDTYTTIVSKLGNKSVYESAVNELLGDYFKPYDEQPTGMSIWHQGEDLLAWNDEVVVEVRREKGIDPNQNDWSYEDPGVYEDEYATEPDTSGETYFLDEPSMEEGTDWDTVIYQDLQPTESDTMIQFVPENGGTFTFDGSNE